MRVKNKVSLCWLVLGWVFIPVGALASDSLFYKEVNFLGGYSHVQGLIGKDRGLSNSIGLEYYRKFSGDYGDYLTADLQLRLAYDSSRNSRDAWGLQIHNAWVKYKFSPEVNLRLGHFDPAFGLEPMVDTHGTILQTLAEPNIGFKQDWGLGLEGEFDNFNYRTALQIGSGMGLSREDDSFLLTGRVGSRKSQDFSYGFSLLYGKVLSSMGMNTWPEPDLMSRQAALKKRIGLDAQYLFGPFLFKAEAAYGVNDRDQTAGYLGEIDYTLPDYQNVELQLQFESWADDFDRSPSYDSRVSLGIAYRFNQENTVRLVFCHDFFGPGQPRDDRVVLQFYYFGL